MSFKVNNAELKHIEYNSKPVHAVYYTSGEEPILVWEKEFDVDTTEWGELKTICQRVASGVQTWPENIKLGVVKELKFTNSTKVWYARIIGIDVEGPGTLTFQIFPYSAKATGASGAYYFNGPGKCAHGPAGWDESTLREKCQEIYETCEAKKAIKPVYKYSTKQQTFPYNTSQLNEETVWLLSRYELGFPCASTNNNAPQLERSVISEGVYSEPYTYCTSSEYMNTIYVHDGKTYWNTDPLTNPDIVWTRSKTKNNLIYVYEHFDMDGEVSQTPNPDAYADVITKTLDTSNSLAIAPCFVIG